MRKTPPMIVGGGAKKVLYTLGTLKRIGLRQSAKALTAKNTCKACGLGMGGQHGGMTNELDEFPSVCNKSIQAQSTDIQPAIPTELFAAHSLQDFRELTGRELEQLGRLNTPLFKAADSQHYQPVSWEQAITRAADTLRKTAPSRSFFYSSGRSSNEAGFILQLLARVYGTNNVNNCSFYCHQATGEALKNTIGSGTATVDLDDLNHCDMVFVIGANPASNHPRFIHKLQKLRERNGHVIIINPAKEPGLVKFAVPKSAKSMLSGGTEIASEYLQPKIGSDILLFKALAKVVLAETAADLTFIKQHTFGFTEFLEDIEQLSWEQIERGCGLSRTEIERVGQLYSRSQAAIFAWGMGMTHHLHGVENIEYISNLALLRGMIGKPGSGLLPLRGHSNVQGIGTIGVKPELTSDVHQLLQERLGIRLPETRGMDTLACLEAAHAGDIDVALIMGGNLYGASPDSLWTAEALDRIDLKIFLTTTLNQGHVHGLDTSDVLVLPVTARDEEWQPTTQESMFNYVRLSDGGIHRLDGVRPESRILTDIAAQLLPDCGIDWQALSQHHNIRKAIAATVPGLEALDTIDQHKTEFHVPGRILHTPSFHTKDQRAHFITHAFAGRHTDTERPFTLMTIRSEGQFNSIIYEEVDSYRNTDDRWSILLNPADIARLGITDNHKVTVSSANGVMKNLRVFPFDIPVGDVMAYYPEANILTGRERDPRSHTPAFKAVAVTITVE